MRLRDCAEKRPRAVPQIRAAGLKFAPVMHRHAPAPVNPRRKYIGCSGAPQYTFFRSESAAVFFESSPPTARGRPSVHRTP